MRRFLAVPFLFFALGVAPAEATIARATAGAPVLPESSTTTHFAIHYTSLAGDPNATTAAVVQQLAANAENVYSVEVGTWGYPPPLDDGDGHVDVNISALPYPVAGRAGWYLGKNAGSRASGTITLDPKYAANRSVLAHEFFHVLQFGMYLFTPGWVSESSARWAEHEGAWGDGWANSNDRGYLAHPEMSFDCQSTLCPEGMWDGGYERWLFWSFLTNRYGRLFVREYHETSAEDKRTGIIRSTDAIDATLRKHQSSLSQTFNDFAVANAARSYPALGASGETVKASAVTAGETTSVAVSHLAARYLAVGPSTAACTAVTLHIRVTGPDGVGAPYVVVGSQANAVTNGVLDLRWLPCGARPIVVLPNTTVNLDAQTFTIATSLGDAAPATPVAVAPASGVTDTAPALALLGTPAVVRVSSSKPVLYLSVSSNAEGKVTVAWNEGQTIAVIPVRPGTNTFRVVLPRGLKGRKMLTLTGASPRGTVGTPLRQTIVFVR
jgi:hypothetical protein